MKKTLSAILVCLFLVQLLAVCPFAAQTPVCTGMTQSGFKSTLEFGNIGSGLTTNNSSDNALAGFQVYSLGSWKAADSAKIASANTVEVKYHDTYTFVRYSGTALCSSDGTAIAAFTKQATRNTTSKTINTAITGTGYDVYTPATSSGYAYQYGPSVIVNDDGSIDVWFASQGSSASNELDYISYTHSSDGGANWTNRKIVLSPTPLSQDRLSCCDPGVIKFGGYYYIGYTSTLDKSGYANSIFVARSTNPDGPYEKWNGSGWGGDPKPLVLFEGNGDQWGIGEPSFVELDGKLYIYYTLRNEKGNYTMVATADASNANWPSTLAKQGVALTMMLAESASDVKYDEASGKFIAMGIVDGFTETSSMLVFESTNGLDFTQVDRMYNNLIYNASNNGLSGSPNGHIVAGDPTFVAYAYGATWGHWATRIAPISITYADSADTSETEAGLIHMSTATKSETSYTMGITTSPHFYIKTVGSSAFTPTFYKFSNTMGRSTISDTSNITLTDYNTNIISVSGLKITPKAAGTTEVQANYQGTYVRFKVVVRASGVSTSSTAVMSWAPYRQTMTIPFNATEQYNVRGIAQTYAGVIGEAFNDEVTTKALFKGDAYPVTYSGYDTSVMLISNTGIIIPVKVGTSPLTCTISGTLSFTMNIVIAPAKPFAMILDTNGGTMGAATEYYTYYAQPFSTILSSIPTPQRPGHTFAGWFNEDYDITFSRTSGQTWPYNGDLIFRAMWDAEEYAVTFDANGGTDAPASQTKYYDVPLAITSAKPTKAGFNFLGWSTSSAATSVDYAAGDEYTYNAPITLYAVYEAKTLEPPYITVDNYTVTIHNIEGANYIRYASGVHTTLSTIRSAPDLVNVSSTTITKGTVDNAYSRTVANGGVYTFWVRYNDGSEYLLQADATRFDQTITTNGLVITLNNLYGVKDYFIAKGNLSTYRECNNPANKIARITANGINGAKSYTYTVREAGDYTICVRYTDTTRASEFLHVNLDVILPIINVNGLQVKITNLDQIKVIRTAPGTWETTGEIKRAEGCRNFTYKTVGTKDPYTIQYRVDGPYTVSTEYYNGVVTVDQINIATKTPTITQDGGKVTLTGLDDLYIIRYAPGTWATSAQVKNAAGAKYIRSTAVVNDSVSVNLTPGTYTLTVQYNEESMNIITVVVQ